MTGEAILTPAWLEPENGFGPRGVQVRAVPDGDGFTITGTKRHVAFAQAATGWWCWPGPATPRATSTCSWSTRPPPG